MIDKGIANPPVLVLIPTFNRLNYFKIAFESVLNQTYKNIDIVVSDNSTNDETEKFIQYYLKNGFRVKYFHHQNFDANDNWNFLRRYQIEDKEHEYVNWLMDDDAFYHRKIEIMLELLLNNPDVSLVTSERDFIDENGNIIEHYKWLDKSAKVDGENMGRRILLTYHNFIGEPTTPLIRKKFLRNNDLCWNEDETGFYAYVDMSTWLQLLSKGNLIWLNQPFSVFRRHNDQATKWAKTKIRFNIEWAKLLLCAWNRKAFLKTKQDMRESVLNWLNPSIKFTLWQIYDKDYQSEDLKELQKIMMKMSEALILDDFDIKYKIISKGLIND